MEACTETSGPTLLACSKAFERTALSEDGFLLPCRYLLLEFPDLCKLEPPQVIAEIGCGCGSSILPVLKANATCRALVSDVSPTAVEMVTAAAVKAGIDPSRLQSSVLDATVFPDISNSPPAGRGFSEDCVQDIMPNTLVFQEIIACQNQN